MVNKIIQVEDLSKSYIISHEAPERYTTMRDVITRKMKNLGSGLRQNNRQDLKEEFFALRDINFEIEQGDRVGIIGRNGAGKSTLLKILSRITEPTTGRIIINGRVASLLEVGTGFHPELTGRENIFLNGAILGMSRAEIKKKFDEIVDFAEVEKFLDTPVKRYSSGMYVRLAFAVAAHLEPEILVVDEVLAVGDAQFQKKCLGKMEEVSNKEGRTILFVSHNMAAILNLCGKGIFLKKGTLKMSGNMADVIEEYSNDNKELRSISLVDRKDRTGTGAITFTALEIRNNQDKIVTTIQTGQDIAICLHFKKNILNEVKNFHIAMALENNFGQRITHLNNNITNERLEIKPGNRGGIVKVYINKIPLVAGLYSLVLYSEVNGEVSDWIKNAAYIDVENGDFYGTGKLMPTGQGDFVLDYKFDICD